MSTQNLQFFVLSASYNFFFFLCPKSIKAAYFGHFLVMVVQSLSHVRLLTTPWTIAHQAPLSMIYPRQGYWGGLPFPSPGDLPDPGIEREPHLLQKISCSSGRFFTSEPPGKPLPLLRCISFEISTPMY